MGVPVGAGVGELVAVTGMIVNVGEGEGWVVDVDSIAVGLG
jgi:hypothetical protein